MHHFNFKDAITTLVPAGIFTGIAAESTLMGLKLLGAGLTVIWLLYRVAIARKELNKK
jgi:hypothetical protein